VLAVSLVESQRWTYCTDLTQQAVQQVLHDSEQIEPVEFEHNSRRPTPVYGTNVASCSLYIAVAAGRRKGEGRREYRPIRCGTFQKFAMQYTVRVNIGCKFCEHFISWYLTAVMFVIFMLLDRKFYLQATSVIAELADSRNDAARTMIYVAHNCNLGGRRGRQRERLPREPPILFCKIRYLFTWTSY